jgi:beta-aspartyl-peptidase (threonine type)
LGWFGSFDAHLGRFVIAAALIAASATAASAADGACTANTRFAVVAHGGSLSERVQDNGRTPALRAALERARTDLAGGAAALDVVERVVRALEDSGAFNAGRAAIANTAGVVETDASIMDGRDMRAGSVASMTRIKNPVTAARLVMDKSPHVMMVGDRGQAYVLSLGADEVEPSYFIRSGRPRAERADHADRPGGTVGAVALDRCGHIAAATSTGGYRTKIPGRVGDAPIIGAGVYAEDGIGGFSATGHGEFFIRFSVAKDTADRMRYLREPLDVAMRHNINRRFSARAGSDGALIGIDAKGNVAVAWNDVGVYRGFATDREDVVVGAYAGPVRSRPRQ